MKLSYDRQNHLANILLKDFLENDFLEAPSRDILFEKIKQALSFFVQEWDDMEQEVCKKIHSIKRGIGPGSSEWDILYNRFFEESFRKKSSLFIKK